MRTYNVELFFKKTREQKTFQKHDVAKMASDSIGKLQSRKFQNSMLPPSQRCRDQTDKAPTGKFKVCSFGKTFTLVWLR